MGTSRQTRWLAALGLLVLVAFCAALATRTPRFSHELPDGSVLKLQSVGYGRKLRLETRHFWEQVLFKLLGTNLPSAFRPHGLSFSSFYPNGSVGLTFSRSFDKGRNTVSPELSLMAEDGREVFCNRRIPRTFSENGVDSFVAVINTRKFGRKDNKLSDELSLWEVPPSSSKLLHLRLYETRQQTSFVDFRIPNPLPIPPKTD